MQNISVRNWQSLQHSVAVSMTYLLAVVRLPSEVVGLCCVAICRLKLSVLVLLGLTSKLAAADFFSFGLPRA